MIQWKGAKIKCGLCENEYLDIYNLEEGVHCCPKCQHITEVEELSITQEEQDKLIEMIVDFLSGLDFDEDPEYEEELRQSRLN